MAEDDSRTVMPLGSSRFTEAVRRDRRQAPRILFPVARPLATGRRPQCHGLDKELTFRVKEVENIAEGWPEELRAISLNGNIEVARGAFMLPSRRIRSAAGCSCGVATWSRITARKAPRVTVKNARLPPSLLAPISTHSENNFGIVSCESKKRAKNKTLLSKLLIWLTKGP